MRDDWRILGESGEPDLEPLEELFNKSLGSEPKEETGSRETPSSEVENRTEENES